jgi:arylsulfatase B
MFYKTMLKMKNINWLMASLFLTGCAGDSKEDSGRPNIVIIVADDFGWNDVGFHGSEIKTPNIDKLASEGIILNRFYSAPVCSPTRAGLLTGKYPDRFNLRNYVFMPTLLGGIPPDEVFIPEMLETAGYKERAAFGKWHLGHSNYKFHPINQGFTSFYGHYNGAIDYFTHKRDGELDWHRDNTPCMDEGYSTDLIEKEAIRFIKDADTDSPFFAYVAFNATHSPMQAKEEDLILYGYDPNAETEDYLVGGSQAGERDLDVYGKQGRGNTSRQTFSAMASAMDRAVGNILQTIKDKGIEENTLVWFLSDNGGMPIFGGNNYPLRGDKHTEWEGGVHVISCVKWPEVISKGSTTNELIAYIDVFPTIEKITSGKNSKETDGINVFPALKGNELPDRNVFLGNSGIVSKKWKMNQGELFLIEEDIREKNDLSKQYPEVVEDLNSKLKEFHKMTPELEIEVQPEGWLPPKDWTMPGQ